MKIFWNVFCSVAFGIMFFASIGGSAYADSYDACDSLHVFDVGQSCIYVSPLNVTHVVTYRSWINERRVVIEVDSVSYDADVGTNMEFKSSNRETMSLKILYLSTDSKQKLTILFQRTKSNVCVDTDWFGSGDASHLKRLSTKGTCTDGDGVHTDVCDGDDALIDYTCEPLMQDPKHCGYTTYFCKAYGFSRCRDGACVMDSPATDKESCTDKKEMNDCLDVSRCYWDQETDSCRAFDPTKQYCSDPDSGMNYYVQGHTFGFRTYASDERDARIRTGGKDACISGKLSEHYCSGSYYIESVNLECPAGYTCMDGACVTSQKPSDWDYSITVERADSGPFFVFSNGLAATGTTYYGKFNQEDNLYTDVPYHETCPPGWERDPVARRAKGWYAERKKITDDKYKVLIRGISPADCGSGSYGYARGKFDINPDSGWVVAEVISCSAQPSNKGQETYCTAGDTSVKFAAGNGCSGCCACADSGGVTIEVIVERNGRRCGGESCAVADKSTVETRVDDVDAVVEPNTDDWDYSMTVEKTNNGPFFVFSNGLAAPGMTYYGKFNKEDNLYVDVPFHETCPPGWTQYPERRAKGWYAERKKITDDKYKVLVRGISPADCGSGSYGYFRGKLDLNPESGWAVAEVISCYAQPSNKGQETYCTAGDTSVKFAAGNGCNGCCACADSGGVNIEVIVERNGRRCGGESCAVADSKTVDVPVEPKVDGCDGGNCGGVEVPVERKVDGCDGGNCGGVEVPIERKVDGCDGGNCGGVEKEIDDIQKAIGGALNYVDDKLTRIVKFLWSL